MTRTIWIGAASLMLAGCGTSAPVRIQADSAAVCEALRTDMPVRYHGDTTDAATVAAIRRANARYRAACP